VRVKQVELNGKEVYLCSKETYLIVNQPVPNSDPEQPRRRFVQMRGLDDPAIAGLVHNVELYPGGRWFSASGIAADGRRLECVLGEGVAVTFGGDYGKPILEPGDTFELGDREWLVVGVLKSEGSTFGSEIWAKQALVGPMFRKETYTTLVLRADPPTPEAAAALAYDLRYRYTPVKVRAVTERDYFNDLSRTNQQFLVAIMVVAIIMAIGGVFGVMNTMFAAISQRIKDIAMLRLLGFKRWQVLVSFLLESLAIALVGGLLGVAVGSLTHGATAQSIISSGQGGGKTVILRLIVDTPTVLAGILFTLAMGRLGGLVPAVSAMRQTPLESLR
jgi:ABC-type antimicrobial peptide transport system permease subunit